MTGPAAAFAGGRLGQHEADAAELLALAEGCTHPGISRRALMVRMAELPARFSSPFHRRAIEAALEPLLRLERSKLFHLADGALVVAWRGPGGAAELAAREALAALLRRLKVDPVEMLDLPGDAERLAQAIDGVLGKASRTRDAVGLPPLDTAEVARLERAMTHLDVTTFARRKPVCRCLKGTPAAIEWEKRLLSVTKLGAALAPGTDLRADPWLFRRLTRSFDRRMLALLSAPDELRDAGPFSIDLNVSSIVGADFLRFDAALPRGLRGEVILGVSPADVLTDPARFGFARDYAHARGFRLLLRSVPLQWAEVLPMSALKVDLMEMIAPDGPGAALPPGVPPARLVLSKVENAAGLAWGREQGIELFEGRAIGLGRGLCPPPAPSGPRQGQETLNR